ATAGERDLASEEEIERAAQAVQLRAHVTQAVAVDAFRSNVVGCVEAGIRCRLTPVDAGMLGRLANYRQAQVADLHLAPDRFAGAGTAQGGGRGFAVDTCRFWRGQEQVGRLQ